MSRDKKQKDDEKEWEYGDVWKQGSPDEAPEDEGIEYVEILRGETGRGFTDSFMLDLVGFLGSRGIRATYDATSVAGEVGGIKTYVLKVEAGKEEEALQYLEEKFKAENSEFK